MVKRRRTSFAISGARAFGLPGLAAGTGANIRRQYKRVKRSTPHSPKSYQQTMAGYGRSAGKRLRRRGRTGRARSKAMTVRGGYAMAPARKVLGAGAGAIAANAGGRKRVIDTIAKSVTSNPERTAAIVTGVIDAGLRVSKKRRERGQLLREQTSIVREPNPMSAPVSPNSYRINVKTGRNYSTAMRMLQKMSGAVNVELENTERDGDSALDRSTLTQTCGFNERLFMTFERSYVTTNTILQTLAQGFTADNLARVNRPLDIYANFLKCTQSLKVANENDFYPVKVKIHMVGIRSDFAIRSDGTPTPNGLGAYEAIASAFRSPDEITAGADSGGKVPSYKQVSGYERSQFNTIKVIATKEANIKESDSFNQKFRIVKTYMRTLDPNDVLYLRHDHQFGSGIYINDMYNATFDLANEEQPGSGTQLLNTPLFTFPMVEVVGAPASVRRMQGMVEENYVGTGMCKVSVEWKTSLSYLPDLEKELADGAPNTTVNLVAPVSTRSFLRAPARDEPVRTVSYDELVQGTEYALVATTEFDRKKEGDSNARIFGPGNNNLLPVQDAEVEKTSN